MSLLKISTYTAPIQYLNVRFNDYIQMRLNRKILEPHNFRQNSHHK